ncbi:MAG: hypothetical protein AAF502_01900 [Bacteroidota bacterium]
MNNPILRIVTMSLLVCSVLMISNEAIAQVKFGLKGGTSIKVAEAADIFDGNMNIQDATFGAHGGVFMRVNVVGIILQPEATISTLKNIDLPLLGGFKLGPVRGLAGPMLRFDLDRNANQPPGNQMSLGDSMLIGFQAGVGVDIKKISLDMRYESNLSGISNDPKFNSGPPQLLLSAGFAF